MSVPPFFVMTPGAKFEHDWFDGKVPDNCEVGDEVLVDSTHCFKPFRSKQSPGLIVGDRVTLWRASLATDEEAVISIGSETYIANAFLVAANRITIGKRVMVSLGVTIADSDFHPLDPASRFADSVALSPVGNRNQRVRVESQPVVIGDDVWIGANAVVLKGVEVGTGATIQPGSVVLKDVPANVVVAGNPAKIVDENPS